MPAWKYQDKAFSPEEAARILAESRKYLEKFNIVIHSGQQDDSAMAAAEQMRKKLREKKWSSIPLRQVS